MARNKALVEALLAALSDDENTPPAAPPAAPVVPPAEPKDDGVKAALEARLAELEAKIASGDQTDPPKQVEPPKGDEESDEVKELRKRVQEQEDIAVTSAIKSGLTEHQIDPEAFDVLSEFFEYGKLKAEDGSADSEKINKIVETLTSIALRNPPSTSGNKKTYDPLNQGLGRYLDK